jgi:hypothetical protein
MKPESSSAAGVTANAPGTVPVKGTPTVGGAPTRNGRFHPAAWRLILVAVLFAGWLGYLGYLVYMQSRPTASIVLSRPQLLVSDVDVIAQVDNADEPTTVTIKEVLYAKKQEGAEERPALKQGDRIVVHGIKRCGRLVARKNTPEPDFTGPGQYLVPLRLLVPDSNIYEVVPTPYSPGYPSLSGPARIYPDSPEVRAQYQLVPKP